jgi:hypothetical protein
MNLITLAQHPMLTKAKLLFIATLLSLILLTLANAQATGGSATGTVLDANEHPIPSTNITIHLPRTGFSSTTQSNESGVYIFPNLSPGEYTIEIAHPSFKQVTKKINIGLNQQSTLTTVLQAKDITVEVRISEQQDPLVQTDTSQLSRNFQQYQVHDLPIFGDPKHLALLSPNVSQQVIGATGEGGFVGGQRSRFNSFTVDGIDNNDPSITGDQSPVIQDAVQEFTIITNNFNSEYGTAGGGQFNTITRSGGNQFHGSLFSYLQNQHLNALSTAEERLFKSGQLREKPRYQHSRFGGTLGGPILRNKLFFFTALEGEINRRSASSVGYLAPTQEGLNQLTSHPLASPYVIDLLRENLELAKVATTNQRVLGNQIPFGVVSFTSPVGFDDKTLQVNLDHLASDKDQFRYRFLTSLRKTEATGFGHSKFNYYPTRDADLFSATWIRAISPTLINDLRLAYRRTEFSFPLKDQSVSNFPNLTVVPIGLAVGPHYSYPQGRTDNNYQLYDAISHIRGKHVIKGGMEVRRLINTAYNLIRPRGDYYYFSFEELIKDSNPSLFARRGLGNTTFHGNQWKTYLFVQDDWKVRPNLTLNLGLRYEYNTIPQEAKLQALNAISSVPGIIEFRAPRPDKNNFAPRIGFSYSPKGSSQIGNFLFGKEGQSALRANLSIAYSEVSQIFQGQSMPPQVQQSEVSLQQSAQALGYSLINRPFLQSGGIPNLLLPVDTPAAARRATGAIIADNTSPETYSFSFSYQRELPAALSMELRYLGTRSRHLPVQIQKNGGTVNNEALSIPTFLRMPDLGQVAGLPTLGIIRTRPGVGKQALSEYGFAGVLTTYEPIGNSQYDALSLSLIRRFSNNLGFSAAYTFSKSMDDGSVEMATSTVNPRRPQDLFNLRDEWALSAFDIPHRLAVSLNYDVPFFTRSNNHLIRTLLGGWRSGFIFQAQSGNPITPISGVDSNLNFDSAADRTIHNPAGKAGTGSGVTPLAVVNGSIVPVSMGDPRTIAYLANNPSAEYIQTGFGARATAGRNTLRSRGFNRTDATFLKEFRFGTDNHYNLQVGAEISNLFNQRIIGLGDYGTIFSFDNPNLRNGLGSGTQILGTAFNVASSPLFNDYSIGDFSGRIVQLRAKFIF